MKDIKDGFVEFVLNRASLHTNFVLVKFLPMNKTAHVGQGKILLIFILGCYSLAFGQEHGSHLTPAAPELIGQTKVAINDNTIKSDVDAKIMSEGTFSLGKGYLIQVPANHPTTPTEQKGTFTGVPHNGPVSIDMKLGFNMSGNPYPSGISVPHFIDDNPTITGALYFLEKDNSDSSSTSYATLTKAAYVSNGAKKEDDSFGYFGAGDESNWFINVAQGFFVHATSQSKLIFTNSMRRISKANPNAKLAKNVAQKSGLYWLNLNKEDGFYSQMAVGYSSSGTTAVDRGIDGKNINLDFYLTSIIDGDDYAVQGRPEFTLSDIVPLSYKVVASGAYTISLDHAIGIFEDKSQIVYLKDKKKSKVHNLSGGPYSFVSKAGTFENRFEIVYKPR